MNQRNWCHLVIFSCFLLSEHQRIKIARCTKQEECIFLSRVESRGYLVEGRGYHVEGRGYHVEGPDIFNNYTMIIIQ